MSGIVCPQCHHVLDQDFGIITCSGCGAMLMIDMDGNPQRMDADASPTEERPQSIIEQNLEPEFVAEEVALTQGQDEPPVENEVVQHSAVGESMTTLESTVVPEPESFSEPKDTFAEIRDFANSELATSPLSYDLILKGIDIGDVRRQLVEILGDERLNFELNDVIRKISNGTLRLEGLNAAKMGLLVLKLRHLPLEISWSQNAYSS